jgi:hypothetical protein
LRHRKLCKLRLARRHIAGTSCTAHSSQGKHEKFADSTVVMLLC